jgi:hypothetical protein
LSRGSTRTKLSTSKHRKSTEAPEKAGLPELGDIEVGTLLIPGEERNEDI